MAVTYNEKLIKKRKIHIIATGEGFLTWQTKQKVATP